MPNSLQFRQLSRRLDRLRELFLPSEFDPLGEYTDSQRDLARAYSLLAHAEIEEFVESATLKTVDVLCEAWGTPGKRKAELINLIAFYGKGNENPVNQFKAGDRGRLLRNKIDEAKARFSTTIKNNNGILEVNLLSMLLPAGLFEYELDSTWLGTMDSFGRLRGGVAHTAASGAQNLPDLSGLYETVKKIVEGLKAVDAKLVKLRQLRK